MCVVRDSGEKTPLVEHVTFGGFQTVPFFQFHFRSSVDDLLVGSDSMSEQGLSLLDSSSSPSIVGASSDTVRASLSMPV